MNFESEGGEPQAVTLEDVCSKIIERLKVERAIIADKIVIDNGIGDQMGGMGGNVTSIATHEQNFIDQTISRVESKDPAILQKFLDRPMHGLELTDDEKRIIFEYCHQAAA